MNQVQRRLLLSPGALLNSLRYSARFPSNNGRTLPVLASASARMHAHRSAVVDLSDRLLLGLFFTQLGEIGQTRYDRTILQLAEGAAFRTRGRTILGPGVRIILGTHASLEIGSETFISANSQVLCRESITIGRECAISWGVQIMDTDFHTLIIGGVPREKTRPVQIGNRVWIGSNASVLKGVRVGDGAVIAAGSIVTRDIPAHTLVAGNPARVVHENIDWTL